MCENKPKVMFKNLKGFPAISPQDRLQTETFLDASREIVTTIESFGRIFMPIVYDMNGNIEKLNKFFQEDKEKYFYLDDLIRHSINTSDNNSESSLLWLKRALELIAKFFHNIMIDVNISENLKDSLKKAYEETLKPHHGWLVQEAFSVIYRLIPSRSQLIGKNEAHDENIECLKNFLPLMQEHLLRINIILMCDMPNSNK